MICSILMLTGSCLLIGWLLYALLKIGNFSSGNTGSNFGGMFLRILSLPFVFYVLPLGLFILFHLIRLVVLGKWSMYQFGQCLRFDLFGQFNGYYTRAYEWLMSLVKRSTCR